MTLFHGVITVLSLLSVVACGGSGSTTSSSIGNIGLTTSSDKASKPTFSELASVDKSNFTTLSLRTLDADGAGIDLSAYELIRELGRSNNEDIRFANFTIEKVSDS